MKLTIGKLLEAIAGLSDDTLITVKRVDGSFWQPTEIEYWHEEDDPTTPIVEVILK